MKLRMSGGGRHGWAWIVLVVTVVVGGVTALAILWMLHEVRVARSDRASLQIDAIRTGLTVGAGAAGAVALALTFRRQWHQEIVAADARHDASERRITELYSKAADQLGSDKAPVRFAGLYALERLAQDNPEHRQTVVNLICAYLRMPYSVPDESDPMTEIGEGEDSESSADAAGEWEVRLTAQRILTDHTCLPVESSVGQRKQQRYWHGMRLNLSGATLINIDMVGLIVDEAEFGSAIFYGHTTFSESTFSGVARFAHATFHGPAIVIGSRFYDMADFNGTHFQSDVMFSQSVFHDTVWFNDVRFHARADFEDVHIRRPRFVSAWPEGWTVEPHEDGGLRLVPVPDDGT